MQAGLFSAVSSAFIVDVESKLQPDPNEMTAAYMRILIHAVNSSLFPDADPKSAAWTGPPPEMVIVQSLLYVSLATSLFAAFLSMLGKQWVNRYLRNRGVARAGSKRDEWCLHVNPHPCRQQFTLPNSAARTEPSPEIVAVQSLLHASLETPLFAAFPATLGRPIYLKSRAETRWTREVALPPRHQEYLGNAPVCLPVARLHRVPVSVDDHPRCLWSRRCCNPLRGGGPRVL